MFAVMFNLPDLTSTTPDQQRDAIVSMVRLITEGEDNFIANAANTASVLFHMMPDVNWTGFYLFDGTELVLGPFHGKPACIRIALGRGVCGTAAAERRTIVVPNVDEFPGHIACDAASASEIVVPIVHDGALIGVLDIDSPTIGRCTEADAEFLQQIVDILVSRSYGDGAQ
jgi:GAF domain-containing protein